MSDQDQKPPKPEPLLLSAGEAVKMSQAYQNVAEMRARAADASRELMGYMNEAFESRGLPDNYRMLPWLLEVAGHDVKLVPQENGEDVGA